MNGHDEAMLDDVAVLALGGLPAAEAQRVAAHVATCEICRREYAELRAAANVVGYAAQLPATGGDELRAARLKARVMAEARTLASLPERKGRSGRAPWFAYGAAAAAIALALGTLANDGALRTQHARDEQRIATLEASSRASGANPASRRPDTRVLDAAVAALLSAHSRHYKVAGGEVVVDGGRVVIALHDVPPVAAGKVYQAWTLARGAKSVAPSITFTPDERGVAVVELPVSARGLAAVAVSVEPEGGSKAPTSKPAFIRPLS